MTGNKPYLNRYQEGYFLPENYVVRGRPFSVAMVTKASARNAACFVVAP